MADLRQAAIQELARRELAKRGVPVGQSPREQAVTNLARATSEAERLGNVAQQEMNKRFMEPYNLFARPDTTPTALRGLQSAVSASIPGGRLTMQKPALAGVAAGAAMPGGLVPTLAGVGAEEIARSAMPEAKIAPLAIGAATGLSLAGLSALPRMAGRKIASTRAILSETPEAIQKFTDDIINLKELKGVETSALKERAANLIGQLKEGVAQTKLAGKESISEQAGMAAEQFQDELARIFKEASSKYGDKLDTITATVGKRAKTILQSDASNAIQKTIKQVQDDLLEAPAFLSKLSEKYSRDVVRNETGQILRAPKTFTIQDVINDIKSLRKLQSGTFMRGERMAAEDLPIEYAIDNLMDTVNKATKGAYSQLQKSYRPVMQMKKSLSRIFKPYAGELGTKAGAGFLQRITRPGAATAEKKLYESVTKPSAGGEFFQPARDVTPGLIKTRQALEGRLSSLGGRIKSVQGAEKRMAKQIADRITQDIAENNITIDSLKQLLKNEQSFVKWAKGIGIGTAIAGLGIPQVRRIVTQVVSEIVR